MPACVRFATPADGPGIARVRVTTWRAAYQGMIPQAYLDELSVPAESVRWSEGLAQIDPWRCTYVAEMDRPADASEADERAGIVGYVMAGPNREDDPEYTAELYAIYVLPDYQGYGLGRSLFQAVTGWLVGQGHRRMILYVLRDNAPARRFYEALGGQPLREQMIETGGELLAEVCYGYALGLPG